VERLHFVIGFVQFMISLIVICIYKIVICSGRYVIGNHLLCFYFVSNLESDGVLYQCDGHSHTRVILL
jgi:hypothetical protein